MHYYLYKITNLVNNKIYVGVHKTKDLNDGYMGSGKIIQQAIQKYGLQNFEKIILETFDTYEEALKKEYQIVNEEFLSRDNTYNLRVGGAGGFDWINKNKLNHTDSVNEKRNTTLKAGYSSGKIKKLSGELNPFWGKTHTEDTKKIISENTKKYNAINGHPKGFLGKSHTEEHKKRVSAIMKEKAVFKGVTGENHPAGGTKWFNNGHQHKRSKTHPGVGWVEGRIIKKGQT
jgi:group I intron endonuclease